MLLVNEVVEQGQEASVRVAGRLTWRTASKMLRSVGHGRNTFVGVCSPVRVDRGGDFVVVIVLVVKSVMGGSLIPRTILPDRTRSVAHVVSSQESFGSVAGRTRHRS